ncbi:exocyst complex component Sec3-domain-containing protein [Apiosordaria backusii]|uniref:Exocyst complex component Sec3-domain-containing protein n=1 Tax=Apiosordaria backusii TaxID=314023 RepID=A0AA40EHJ8_9PEZI|nr:exocyst complex component Sec3-domain-containing protein [Apiosordaria backusii]
MSMNGREMTRAELFEDEKRRIIESCFNKRDEDGSFLETYITHIKITEFQTSPTAPPPPNARTPNAEKPRVIIVAVRKSGRVRVHKSKENPNGTFSIGKTWFLDDLSAIESFTNCTYNDNYQAWAGDVGFVVTLGKPYYWQAQTDKEKKFFIASLIKIYGKYTGGRMPTMTGFDQRELDQVLGGAQAPRKQERPPPRPAPLDSAPSSANNSISSGYNGRDMFNSQGAPAPAPTYPERMPSRGALVPNGRSSPVQSVDSGRPSQELPTLRRLASNNKSQDSVVASSIARSEGASSLRPGSRNGPGSSYGTPEASPAPPSLDEKPPERKRPPMDPLRPSQVDRDLVPAPLMSPAVRQNPMAIPPRSMDRMSPRKNSVTRRDGIPLRMDQRPVTPKEISRAGTPVSVPSPAPVPTPPTASPAPAPAAAAVPPPPPPPAEEPAPEIPPTPASEDEKPGVFGIKSKKSRGEIAGAIWKAAAAVSAFKPRPGGAAERLRQNQNKSNDGPDGITSVVPAPPKPVPVKTPEPIALEPPPKAADRASSATTASGIPELKVTGSEPNSRPDSISTIKEKKAIEEIPEEPQRSVVAGNDVKYLATLGIDPSILDTKTSEFAKWLDYFGWVPGEQMRQRNFEEMRADLDREMSKAQAGGWLARFQEEDERVDAIKKGIDLAIGECDELDNLLTLYSVELSTLSDDIAYIEAQGQGLQVQAANQKLLRKELESLLETCAISEADLEALKSAPLEHAAGVEEIESALVTLFKAMIKIDPTMGNAESRQSEDGGADQSLGLDENYGQMRIVQEKKEMYLAESSLFMRRLVIFMEKQFSEAFSEIKTALDGALSKKVDPRNHDVGRDILWMYGPLILYARDVDLDNWNRILQIYQDKCHPIYKTEFKEAMDAWKKNARKVTGDEAELLFTSQQEKKEEGLATTARKLTVKRSQTLARSLRSPLGDGSRSNLADKTPDGRALPYEVFAGVLDDLLPLVEMEQNFIVDFFHATTLEQADFPDLVAASRPMNRRGGDLKRHRLMEPDRELARRVTKAMESIFLNLETSLQQLMDWVLGMDPLQGVGILATLERKMADMSQSNQDFLNNLLQKLHGNLEVKFKKFVDDQIRAIEETKVKIKKRKGVIHFIRIFPQFSTAVENMLANVDPNLGVRRMVDREYDRILKSMFDSLKVIARENPAMGGGGVATAAAIANSADPEDKEALNFHILLIENMNHYLEEVDNSRQLEVLDDWKEQAQQELQEHMGLYLNAVMRRPLGKLLEYLENIEAQLAGGKSPAGIAAQPSNSKTTFNKVLGGYDGKEVRKGIEALRKRVEKHFGDDDSGPGAGGKSSDTLSVSSGVSGHHSLKLGGGGGGGSGSNSGLVMKVLRECEKFYGEVEMRIGRVTTDVYGGDVLFEWPRGEVKAAFAAGGGGGGGVGIHLGR